jgi:putative chitinase
MITLQSFHKLFPNCTNPQGWVTAMESVLPSYDINTPQRVAAFLAQCGHESGGWTKFEEGLNYSAERLVVVFKKYFPTANSAIPYHRKPEMIANRVYAGRMGNGSPESGDGYKYRGRGPIQLTGKSNYTSFAKAMVDDWQTIIDNPDLVSQDKEIALKSAIWFWNTNKLNQYADVGDIKTMTRIINGGYNGLEDRIHHYEDAIKLLT